MILTRTSPGPGSGTSRSVNASGSSIAVAMAVSMPDLNSGWVLEDALEAHRRLTDAWSSDSFLDVLVGDQRLRHREPPRRGIERDDVEEAAERRDVGHPSRRSAGHPRERA